MVTIELTEAEALEIVFLLSSEHDRLYWLNVPSAVARKRGRELAKREMTIIKKFRKVMRND